MLSELCKEREGVEILLLLLAVDLFYIVIICIKELYGVIKLTKIINHYSMLHNMTEELFDKEIIPLFVLLSVNIDCVNRINDMNMFLINYAEDYSYLLSLDKYLPFRETQLNSILKLLNKNTVKNQLYGKSNTGLLIIQYKNIIDKINKFIESFDYLYNSDYKKFIKSVNNINNIYY